METAREFVEAFDRGDSVFTVEMGGLGPGYEQAIQLLVVEIVRDHLDTPLPEPKEANEQNWADATAFKHSDALGGLSGAQVGAAKNLAYRILRDGHKATLDSIRAHDASRVIQVSKTWPTTAGA